MTSTECYLLNSTEQYSSVKLYVFRLFFSKKKQTKLFNSYLENEDVETWANLMAE